MQDKIIQVSGFGVKNTSSTQCNYLLVALTESGKVLLSEGDGDWSDVSPNEDVKHNCTCGRYGGHTPDCPVSNEKGEEG